MATTKNKSESMKNKSKMWGGDKSTSSKSSNSSTKNAKTATTKSQGSKSATAKASSSSSSKSSSSKSGTTSSKASGVSSSKKSSSAKASEAKPTQKSKTISAKGGNKMNSKTEFAQDMTALTDVEIISDVLTSHKGLVKLYGTALCESSCENMRDLVSQHLTECGEDQFDVFLYMSERNLYPTEEAPAPKLTKAKEKFKQYEKQMKK